MVICLERGANLHMSQLMPLPLTVSCFSKIQIGFTFLVPAHLGSSGQGPLNGCVCVCVCVIKLLLYILFEKYINILALEMASPENQRCASCIGTLSFFMGTYHS